jgi:hypothetical protein
LRVAGLNKGAGKGAVKAHAVVEAFSTKLLKVRHSRWRRVVIETDDDLLQISLLADPDLHDGYFRPNRGGDAAGQRYEDKDERRKQAFH